MTKAELKQYISREKEMRHLEGIILRLRTQLESPVVPVFSNMPRSKRSAKDRTGEVIANLQELMHKYNQLWDEKIDLQRKIEDAISLLEPKEQHLMRLRYLEGHSWEYICEALDYSERQVFNLHGEALQALRNRPRKRLQ